MQMINALVKTQHNNDFIFKRMKHTFILKVVIAKHSSL